MINIKWKMINKKGFTLLELIIVIAVIAIISTVVMTAVNPIAQFQKANDGRIKSDLAQLQRALESYYEDNGRYPTSVDFEIQTIADPGVGNNWGDPWTPYMDFLPKSPGSRTYAYFATDDGQSYFLYANLERGAYDPQACKGVNNVCDGSNQEAGGPSLESACGGICNYGVTSPNENP
ncbi:MAG: hypothetical protein A2W22_06860 [Candidatus Levybacteria bacterium RBG_16_35_11]|nr:MAG: hypothetical protein A2W22_06860 [Candidatus Levybacteria bacterium RBG_16_35_11]